MTYWSLMADLRYSSLTLDERNPDWDLYQLEPLQSGLPHRVQDTWIPPHVRLMREDEFAEEYPDPDRPFQFLRNNHIMDFEGLFVWNTVARQCLEPLVGHCVELLPLDCQNAGLNPLWMVNVIHVADCLDHTQSEFAYFPSGNMHSVTKYVFKPGCLEGQHMFRMPEFGYRRVYVSDTFKALVESCGLKGLDFYPQWD